MLHHGRFNPRSPRKEELELGSPMVSYKGPITRSRAKFVKLVTHLDDKEAFGSFKGIGVIFRVKRGSFEIVARWLGRGVLRHELNKPELPFKPFFLVEQLRHMFPYL